MDRQPPYSIVPHTIHNTHKNIEKFVTMLNECPFSGECEEKIFRGGLYHIIQMRL